MPTQPVVQMTMDVLGRPTLLQVHNTAEQATGDVRVVAQDLEALMSFLSRPETEVVPDDVSAVLSHWGPNLAALSSKPEANGAAGADAGSSGMSTAVVLAGASQQGHGSAGSAGAFGGLDPAAARRLARQCAAKGASVLLGQLTKQLNLIEQCLMIVLLHFVQVSPYLNGVLCSYGAWCELVVCWADSVHFSNPAAGPFFNIVHITQHCDSWLVPTSRRLCITRTATNSSCVVLCLFAVCIVLSLLQCLPRPDTSAVTDAGADDMQLDTADGSVADALMPNPGPEMAAMLGDANALRFFAARMRHVCSQAAGMGSDVRKLLGADAADSAGGAAAIGTKQWLDSLDAVDLLTRRLNAYLADR